MKSAQIDKGRGLASLLINHCAGMVDMVGLGLWVAQLITYYKFDEQQAGGMATLFLGCVVVASVVLAPRFHKLSGRKVAAVSYALSAISFFVAAQTQDIGVLVAVHALAGLATGAGLSVTHGTMSQGASAHRLISHAGVALGVFAVIFLGIVPKVVAVHGGPAVFGAFAAVQGFAALFSLFAFPAKPVETAASAQATSETPAPLPKAVWFGLAGLAAACVAHAMANAFMVHAGTDHNLNQNQINASLLVMAIFSIFPGILAAMLEKKLNVRGVLFIAPIAHVILASLLVNATNFPVYLASMALLPGIMIFVHAFSFGAVAKLDRSGRSLAAFPASLMIGTALGPIIGGTLLKSSGYAALGVGILVCGLVVVLCFLGLTAKRKTGATAVASAV
jgi:predicted MFS family arabinose efflux permease